MCMFHFKLWDFPYVVASFYVSKSKTFEFFFFKGQKVKYLSHLLLTHPDFFYGQWSLSTSFVKIHFYPTTA